MNQQTGTFRSNCLLEAVKAKARDPTVSIRFKKSFPVPHWYWKRGDRCYHFSAIDKDLSNREMIWFEGKIVRYFRGET